VKNVQNLINDKEGNSWFLLLQIFAHGTYPDYLKSQQMNNNSLPALNEIMLKKLRQLTIISLSAEFKSLSYSKIIPSTGLSTFREVEDLIISCVYDNLLHARIDQKNQIVHIQYSAGRDVLNLDGIILKLDNWINTASNLLSTLENSVNIAEASRIQDSEQLELILKVAESTKRQILLESEKGLMNDFSSNNVFGNNNNNNPRGSGGNKSNIFSANRRS